MSAKPEPAYIPVAPKSELHRVAQAYARAGLAVFPLRPGSKLPLPGSHGHLDATSDLGVIDRWWAASPQYNVGAVPGSIGCTVIDLDEKQGREGGRHFDTLSEDATGEPAPATRTARTVSEPPGHHRWYTGTVEWEGGDGTLGEGVQVKCRKGYVVMPPSIVAGKTYTWCDTRERIPLPPFVVEALDKIRSEKSKPREKSKLDDEPVSREAFIAILSYLDPDEERDGWRDKIASIHASPVAVRNPNGGKWDMLSDMDLLGIAIAWSRGEYDRLGRYKDAEPERFTDDGDVEAVFWSLPPRDGGRGFGSLVREARAAGYTGPNSTGEEEARERMAEDIGKYAERSDAMVLDRKDPMASAAQFLRRRYVDSDGIKRLLHYQGDFYAWTGTHYAVVDEERLRSEIYEFLNAALQAGEELQPFRPTVNKVNEVLSALKAQVHLPSSTHVPSWLSGYESMSVDDLLYDPQHIVSFKNGLLYLPTRELMPHTPRLFSLNALDFDYDPKAPPPSEWLKLLASIWPDDAEAIGTLQEMFGYFLSGDLRQQKAFLIVGPKRGGKGTIARIMRALLGPDNVAGPTLASLGQNFGLAPLIGKRAAIISDARLGTRADQQVIAERLLSITGEDALTIDRKFRDAWTGRLPVRFLVLSNELPRLTDASGALVSRFILLTLRLSFYGKEDLGLLDRLMRELPGILNWSLAGWDRLQARGHFVQPKSSAEALQQLEDLTSPIGAFVRERCIVGADQSIEVGELYLQWDSWCRAGNRLPGTPQTFGRDLRAALPTIEVMQARKHGGVKRFYRGVGLRPVEGVTQVTRF